jgi:hypothetical protein
MKNAEDCITIIENTCEFTNIDDPVYFDQAIICLMDIRSKLGILHIERLFRSLRDNSEFIELQDSLFSFIESFETRHFIRALCNVAEDISKICPDQFKFLISRILNSPNDAIELQNTLKIENNHAIINVIRKIAESSAKNYNVAKNILSSI